MTPEERKKYVLRWVNERRKEGGLKATSVLSKGEPGLVYKCSIARSLSKVGVMLATYSLETVLLTGHSRSGVWRYREFHEPEVSTFMRDFDSGRYPELERA